MGNSSSQQVDPEKFFLQRERAWGHHSLKGHHQGHLIIPLTDAVIQRKMLRNTENGQILQNEGTISQRRRSMRHPDEGMFSLNPSRRTLSDSDLSRTQFDHVIINPDSYTQKSVIAVSPSKAKIKLRKNKAKAPEPPPLGIGDPRGEPQRRFVRSNSSLCPRTWENEFHSLNIERPPKSDGRSRQQIIQSSRPSRTEPALSRRQEKAVSGSQKSITSLVSQRSGAKTPVNTRSPARLMNNIAKLKRDISDTPKPSPAKPQFYFSNMDALKKETPKANAVVTREQSSSPKSLSTPKATSAVKENLGKKPPAKALSTPHGITSQKRNEEKISTEPKKVKKSPADTKPMLQSSKIVTTAKVRTTDPSTSFIKSASPIPRTVEKVEQCTATQSREKPKQNIIDVKDVLDQSRQSKCDNVIFKVNPSFGLLSMNVNVPQTATQILDELDATLDNYSQLSTGRKSDDSDYCEPEERDVPSAAVSALGVTNTQIQQPAVSNVSRITPPKSLEMLFRPPSPKEFKSLQPPKFNGLDLNHLDLTSISSDKPPTPPPIPASWLKLGNRRTSLSSEEEREIDLSVHIRPCLPRRPLIGAVPSRFSPTHAWKSLDPAGSDGDQHDDKSLSDDCELNFSSSSSSDEDRKEETPLKAHLSVDSGITGGYSNPHHHWTPKEDLIDTDSESTGGNDLGLSSLPNQARFMLPSMFLSQNASGVDSNWSFKSGPNSLQQKSQSVVYLPPPRSNENTVHISNTNNRPSLGSRNPPSTVGISLNLQTPDPLLEAERLREKEQKWMQKVEEEFRKRREKDRQALQEQMQLFNSLSANIRPDPEGSCDHLQVR